MSIRIDRITLSDPEGPQGPMGPDGGDDGGLGIATKTRVRTKKPSMYRVLILNDDYTPMEFVVLILERFFNKSREQATRIMLHVHQKGVGVEAQLLRDANTSNHEGTGVIRCEAC